MASSSSAFAWWSCRLFGTRRIGRATCGVRQPGPRGNVSGPSISSWPAEHTLAAPASNKGMNTTSGFAGKRCNEVCMLTVESVRREAAPSCVRCCNCTESSPPPSLLFSVDRLEARPQRAMMAQCGGLQPLASAVLAASLTQCTARHGAPVHVQSWLRALLRWGARHTTPRQSHAAPHAHVPRCAVPGGCASDRCSVARALCGDVGGGGSLAHGARVPWHGLGRGFDGSASTVVRRCQRPLACDNAIERACSDFTSGLLATTCRHEDR